MSFMMALQAIGTGLKIVGALQGAKAQQQQAAFDLQQLELKKQQDQLIALQRQNLRNAEFDSAEATNRATFFGGLGRDTSDRSVKAFLEKQREIASEDIEAIQLQTTIGDRQIGIQQRVISMRSKSAYQSALLGASTAIASGLYRYLSLIHI